MGESKITVIGDIMCEPLLIKAARRGADHYDFDCVFENVKEMFSQSDYVIGNLEAPLTDKDDVYAHDLFKFNAPGELANAVKNSGVDFVSTANNHCLDHGFDGLLDTVRILNSKGIAHHGTHDELSRREEAHYFNVGGTRAAVIAYTCSANYAVHKCPLNAEQEKYINFLHPYTEPIYISDDKTSDSPLRNIKKAAFGWLKIEQKAYIKKMLGMTYNTPRVDDYFDERSAAPYFQRLREDIKKAKEHADLVIFYPHIGGQFNIEPGKFTLYTIQKAVEFGADAVIASHAHIVQRAEMISGSPCFYSIGNFSMSPNSVYLLHKHLPDYGLAVHLYVEDKRIKRTTFSILKIVETKTSPLTVYPVDKYIAGLSSPEEIERVKRNVAQIYTVVTGRQPTNEKIKSEFDLF